MSPGDEAFRLAGFSLRLGGAAILRDLSFAVARGDFVSIIGPNGAGKTTLVKCLNRIVTGGTGEIELFGRSLASYAQREVARLVSYVPQADGRLCPFTVHEFVLMGRYPYVRPFSGFGERDEAVVLRALETTGVEGFRDRIVSTLSGGECQRVFIAAALAQEAPVLVLDEPTTFLDYRHRGEIVALLRRLNREAGLTVLSVTHDLSAAALSGDRVVALKEGSLVFNGTPRELIEGGTLERIYGVAFRIVSHPDTGEPSALPREGAT